MTAEHLAARLRALPPDDRQAWLDGLSTRELVALRYYWPLHARPEQLPPPGDWDFWLVEAGRGYGKTRIGAEYIIEGAQTGKSRHMAAVARTAKDVRATVVEGVSGILACSHPSWRPHYEPSKCKLTWPNGAICTTFAAAEPESLRGPQHDRIWADELASWRYADAWDQLRYGLRIGAHPTCVVSTTPRPTPLMRKLRANPRTARVTGSTFDNAENLAPAFLQAMIDDYAGTRMGRQELYAEILDDVEGALWHGTLIEAGRHHWNETNPVPTMQRVVVGLDPATTSRKTSDEVGIVTCGIDSRGHVYVLHDASARYSPDEWGRQGVVQYHGHSADRIVAETNQGGDMVATIIRGIDSTVAYQGVHAKRGKHLRAEPVVALYEQGKVHHVGYFSELEQEMTSWVPHESPSPNRVDALVYAITALMVRRSVAAAPAPMDQPSRWVLG